MPIKYEANLNSLKFLFMLASITFNLLATNFVLVGVYILTRIWKSLLLLNNSLWDTNTKEIVESQDRSRFEGRRHIEN